jgi:AraC-like DNA-binding protein
MGVSADEFAPTRFSTDDLPQRDRLPRWREEFGRVLVRVDIEPVSSEPPFRAEAVLRALPGVNMVWCDGSAAHYIRTKAMAAAQGDDSIGLVVNLGSQASVSQLDRNVMLGRGDAFPMLHEEAATLTSTGYLGLLFPRDALASRVDDLDRVVGRMILNTAEPLRLLVNYLTLLQEQAGLGTPGLRQPVVGHVHDLAALALGANRDTRENGLGAVAAARLAAALADINRSFTDPSLTLAVVARRQGVSPRYLQRLLEESRMSFTARVNELRLQRAFALLSKPHSRGRRISDVAWQAGFSNVSHFNRLFRSRFGDTPTGTRA